MAQTEHLGLHQWETTDSFLRTDFNEDFAKIDAAVGTMEEHLAAVPVEKIASVNLAEKSSQMELDLSGIDLSRYTCLRLVWYGVGTARSTVCMRVNGLTGNIYYSQTVGSSSAQNDGNSLSGRAFRGGLRRPGRRLCRLLPVLHRAGWSAVLHDTALLRLRPLRGGRDCAGGIGQYSDLFELRRRAEGGEPGGAVRPEIAKESEAPWGPRFRYAWTGGCYFRVTVGTPASETATSAVRVAVAPLLPFTVTVTV